jgi:uncharacterized membrane protein YphA (DoxX/SURF4 family)
MTKRKKIIYWVATTLLALGMFSGGVAQLFQVKENVDGIFHLGYPAYFLTIIGIWKILGVIAIMIPNFALLKEWAYAGFFFAMTGAVLSYVANGDQFTEFMAPLFFALLTIVSWYFRPADRKIISAT